MIFDALYESAQRGELLCVADGVCHWHMRRDKQITIREIISMRPGVGTEMLERLKQVSGATSIFACCPADLPSNEFYRKKGFVLEGTKRARSGRAINQWRLTLEP